MSGGPLIVGMGDHDRGVDIEMQLARQIPRRPRRSPPGAQYPRCDVTPSQFVVVGGQVWMLGLRRGHYEFVIQVSAASMLCSRSRLPRRR
jgi:hypothetical protein